MIADSAFGLRLNAFRLAIADEKIFDLQFGTSGLNARFAREPFVETKVVAKGLVYKLGPVFVKTDCKTGREHMH